METRSKKKKSDVTSPSTEVSQSSTDCNSSADFRNWSDLPHDLLLPIFNLISFSIPDILAFAAVCRSWRSLAATATASSPFCGPPLLLTPVLSHLRRPRWSGPPRCRLQTLALTNNSRNLNPRTYQAVLDFKTLRNRCIGCSYGHLIFAIRDRALLVNAFSGVKIRSPKFPSLSSGPCRFLTGILTAPLSSATCTLLLVASSCTLFWRLDSNAWVREEYLRHGQEIRSLAVCNRLVYCLDDRYRVKVVDFDLLATWKTLELRLPQPPTLHVNFGKYLVECGGELLLVLFASLRGHRCRIEVYRLDFSEVKWVKKENLGDWCLFVDVVGNCPVACSNPERWGGRSNCIYIAGSGYDNWSVYSLDGLEIDTIARHSALSSSRRVLPGWPSPIWIYPSKLL